MNNRYQTKAAIGSPSDERAPTIQCSTFFFRTLYPFLKKRLMSHTKHQFRVVAALLAGGLLGSSAHAAVILTSRQSGVDTSAVSSTNPSPGHDSSSVPGLFTATVTTGTHLSPGPTATGVYARADQQTTAEVAGGDLSVTGAGSVQAQSSGGTSVSPFQANGSSGLFVDFDVTDSAADYSFSVTLAIGGAAGSNIGGGAQAIATLDNAANTLHCFSFEGSSLLGDAFSQSGTLPIGSYHLAVTGDATMTTTGSTAPTVPSFGASYTDLSFTVTPVPEPTSLSLLALGAMAMLRRRRRAH